MNLEKRWKEPRKNCHQLAVLYLAHIISILLLRKGWHLFTTHKRTNTQPPPPPPPPPPPTTTTTTTTTATTTTATTRNKQNPRPTSKTSLHPEPSPPRNLSWYAWPNQIDALRSYGHRPEVSPPGLWRVRPLVQWNIWMFPKMVGFPPKSSISKRVFHYFHHLFLRYPYFWMFTSTFQSGCSFFVHPKGCWIDLR